MFQEWKQSAELQAKELQKTVKNTLQSFADNLKEPAAAFNVRDSEDLSLQKIEITTFTTMVLTTGNIYDDVVLLFYVHGEHLRSCRDGQITLPHFSWTGSDLLSG